jgi:hypothetical protein
MQAKVKTISESGNRTDVTYFSAHSIPDNRRCRPPSGRRAGYQGLDDTAYTCTADIPDTDIGNDITMRSVLSNLFQIYGQCNHSMIGDIVNNKHVEAAAQSDAAARSAIQFKPAVTNALVNTSAVHADCMFPARPTPRHRRRVLQKVSADTSIVRTLLSTS